MTLEDGPYPDEARVAFSHEQTELKKQVKTVLQRVKNDFRRCSNQLFVSLFSFLNSERLALKYSERDFSLNTGHPVKHEEMLCRDMLPPWTDCFKRQQHSPL